MTGPQAGRTREGWACPANERKMEVPQGHHEITYLVQLAQFLNGEKRSPSWVRVLPTVMKTAGG